MNGRFLGRGWGFPPGVDRTGKIRCAEGEDDVRESILLILGTIKGERVMRPDFGCGLKGFVYASISSRLKSDIESAVREALIKWEPRIDVLNVTAGEGKPGEGRLDIVIDYRIRATNSEFNLVYHEYYERER